MEQKESTAVKKEMTKEQIDSVIKENTELRQQLEGLIKRYKKLSVLFNDVVEKFLSE